MRFISILLSIYFISISVMPCADGMVIYSNHETELATEHHSNECPDGMECSPFCACACCGCVGFNTASFQSVNILSIYNSEITISYTATAFVAGFLSSIWQPPKIS